MLVPRFALVLGIALVVGCQSGRPASVPAAPSPSPATPVSPAPARNGGPTRVVTAGMVQTACSDGLHDCAGDELCVVSHTGANLARCIVDPCGGAAPSCACAAADACSGMTCEDSSAARRTIDCTGGVLGAP